MSFLTVIQNSCKRLGLPSPSLAYASTDPQVVQFVGLAQQEGIELASRHSWAAMTKEKTFTGTAAAAQTGAIPTGFDRFVDESFYNRTKRKPLRGPISPQDWQNIQATSATTIIESFRVRGTSILITPTPNGTDSYAYEYISTYWCQSNASVEQALWAADTDTGILSEELMTLGIIWRFKKAKGLDYAEDFRTYETQVAQVFSRDGGRRRVSMASSRPPGPGILAPEGSWNLS